MALVVGCGSESLDVAAASAKPGDGAGTGGAAASGSATGGYTCCASGLAASLPPCGEIPEDVPSRQRVTVVVRNDTTEDRYVITQGISCTPFGVSTVADAGVTDLVLQGYGFGGDLCPPNTYTCDAPAPTPTAAAALRPGESHSLVWDARASAGCLAPNTGCPERVHPISALEPVPAGDYRITVKLDLSPPNFAVFGMMGCGEVPTACPSDASASVDVSLPASGDVTVVLPLT